MGFVYQSSLESACNGYCADMHKAEDDGHPGEALKYHSVCRFAELKRTTKLLHCKVKKTAVIFKLHFVFSNLTIPAYDVVVDPVDLMWFVFHLHFCGFIGLIRIKK